MSQGLVQAIEGLLSQQVELAKKINTLADRQFSALRGEAEYSADDAAEMARMTSGLEVYEAEKSAMLQKAGLAMADVKDLSAGVVELLEQLRTQMIAMREAVGRNAKLLDDQITRTKSMISAVRLALSAGGEPATEYDPRGRVRGSASGSLLGAG